MKKYIYRNLKVDRLERYLNYLYCFFDSVKVIARIFLHQNQKLYGTVLKVHIFLDLGYGMHCRLP